MNDAQRIAKAERAQKLLNDADLTEAFENVRRAIHDRIDEVPLRDTEGLVHLRLCLKLLTDVRANLTAALNDGKVVEFKVTQEEEAKKRRFGTNLFR